MIPGAVRALLVVVGILALIAGAILFILPNLLIVAWAWKLTPLTARVIGAVLTLPGMVNLWMLFDRAGRRSAGCSRPRSSA